jgi:chromate transporter
MARGDALWSLAAVFVPFSLAAVGGTPSILAGIQHESVEVHHWLTAREFVELFAVARGTPGPGSMLVTLIGWKVAGWTGALVATLALYLPSSLVLYAVAGVWNRYRGRHWHTALQEGLAPIGAGLILAGSLVVLRIMGTGPLGWVVAVGAALVLGFMPKLNPLLLFVAGAAIFIVVSLT